MDIRTLLHNLREEVSCSVCSSIFTDPKQLPCLHSFCLQCLTQWRRASYNGRGTIKCPNCLALSKVPESGDLKDLPTSFYLNGMIDVLTIKECNSGQVRCGNCDEKSSESSYCFQCCAFWCEECVSGHNIIRSNKDHRVLAVKEFQDKDYEDVLKRPVLCTKQRHQKEELKYFCKDCEAAVCQTCVTLEHTGHVLEHIEEAAERQKIQMRSVIETQRKKLQAKTNAVSQLKEDCAKVIQQGEEVKRNAETFANSIISAMEAKKRSIFEAVDNQTKKSLERLTKQKTEMEYEANATESSLEKADKLLTRSVNAEIVQLKKTFATIVGGVSEFAETVYRRDPEGLPVFAFVENQKMLDYVNTEEFGSFRILQQTKASQSVAEGQGLNDAIVGREAQFVLTTKDAKGKLCYNESDLVTVDVVDEKAMKSVTEVLVKNSKDGFYEITYFPRDYGTCKVGVKINGESIRGSPFPVQVKSMKFTPLLSFGKKCSSVRMLNSPCGLAVNDCNEIAVTELSNHRVQLYTSDGNYLRSFGRQGSKEGQFNKPTGIAFDKNGHILVADSGNHRIQIFSGLGEYLDTFGKQGNLNQQLCNPHGLSIDSDGNIIVADSGNKLIKFFSPNGEFLMQIGEQGSFTCPTHCVQYGENFIVSDGHEHCIKMFDGKGNFKFAFGKQGGGEGEFNNPRCLSMSKSGHLMVCDSWNNRIQIFELNGKLVYKFGTKGENLGEFKLPSAIAVLSNGRIVVSERYNDRVQLFD
ncbi:E3 ubiquitin-protein ligase TRIM71-like [Orbicella faveolata]|uniref:E3 ubiquitin-protein ligase TRIM71-like n=1 Tax=Orbicella faveolata TaxID=48498 RepID=UPI0009E35C4A|nr:E3 ubiquitin-protein ligase TRIM71-like [Orbicella faveolata]